MAATDPSAVFFCAHDSHDKCITTPVNGYSVIKPRSAPAKEPVREGRQSLLADELDDRLVRRQGDLRKGLVTIAGDGDEARLSLP